jgi:hypothetical protein
MYSPVDTIGCRDGHLTHGWVIVGTLCLLMSAAVHSSSGSAEVDSA